jgi:FkbM family methyltransferase
LKPILIGDSRKLPGPYFYVGRYLTFEAETVQMTDRQNTKNLIYDVGMHKGEDTDFYLKKGFNVVAFEANPDLVNLCKELFSAAIAEEKLVIIEGAIVDAERNKAETIHFYKNTQNTVWGTVADDWAGRNEKMGAASEIIEVPTIDFGECLEKFGIPFYLKIDIEGMDLLCIEALLHCKEKPDYISIESEKVDFKALEKEFDLLEQLGYTDFKAVNQASVPAQREPENSTVGKFANYTFPAGATGLFAEDLKGQWKNREEILAKYRWIFRGYRWFGDHSKVKKFWVVEALRGALSKILSRHIPGWFDTHARHRSVSEKA